MTQENEEQALHMHDPVLYKGKKYFFGYYSAVLGRVVIYELCERHRDHFTTAKASEVTRYTNE